MPVHFDAYEQWLGIPPSEQPPNHYRLLGVQPFEPYLELIVTAADERIGFLRGCLDGEHAEAARRLIQEVTAARQCLSDPLERATYDRLLQNPGGTTNPAGGDGPAESAGSPLVTHTWGAKLLLFLAAFVVGFGFVVGLAVWRASSRQAEPSETGAVASRGGPTIEPGPQEAVLSPLPSAAVGSPGSSGPLPPEGRTANPAPAMPTDRPSQTPAQPAPPAPKPSDAQVSIAPGAEPASSPATPDAPPMATPPSLGEQPSAGQPDMPPGGAEKLPVPSSEEQQRVLRQLKEVFDLDRSRTPEEELELARKLFDLSRQSPEKAAERFVLLRTAMDRAGVGGDAALMLEAVDAIGESFAIDVLDVKQKVLNTFAQTASSSAAIQSLIENTLAAVDDAVQQEDYAAALRLIGAAYAATRRSAGSSYRKEVSARRDEIEKLLHERQEIEQAENVLKTDPDNGPANLAMGRWYCLVKDDWEQGLPHLAKGSDPRLQVVAQRELIAAADDVDEQLAVADAWWDVAQTRGENEKPQLLRHARQWYEQARSKVGSSLLGIKLDKRLEEIARLTETGSASQPELKPGDGLPELKWVDLSSWIDPAGSGVSGQWEQQGSELRVKADSFSRIMLPVTVTGNYELQFEFIRSGGDDAVAAVLPVGKRGCVAVLGGGHGKYSGLEVLAKKPADNNSTTRKPSKFNNGQRYSVLVRVRIQGDAAAIEAAINGVLYLRGIGPQDSLAVSRNWALRRPDQPGLGANQSDVTFRNVRLRVLKGGTATLAAADKASLQ